MAGKEKERMKKAFNEGRRQSQPHEQLTQWTQRTGFTQRKPSNCNVSRHGNNSQNEFLKNQTETWHKSLNPQSNPAQSSFSDFLTVPLLCHHDTYVTILTAAIFPVDHGYQVSTTGLDGNLNRLLVKYFLKTRCPTWPTVNKVPKESSSPVIFKQNLLQLQQTLRRIQQRRKDVILNTGKLARTTQTW